MFERLATAALPAFARRFGHVVHVEGGNGFALPEGSLDPMDPLAQMAQADAADASLLRLVLCAAGATLMLALASSLL